MWAIQAVRPGAPAVSTAACSGSPVHRRLRRVRGARRASAVEQKARREDYEQEQREDRPDRDPGLHDQDHGGDRDGRGYVDRELVVRHSASLRNGARSICLSKANSQRRRAATQTVWARPAGQRVDGGVSGGFGSSDQWPRLQARGHLGRDEPGTDDEYAHALPPQTASRSAQMLSGRMSVTGTRATPPHPETALFTVAGRRLSLLRSRLRRQPAAWTLKANSNSQASAPIANQRSERSISSGASPAPLRTSAP